MPKHNPRRDDDPIATYVEWTQHRYDPGYYLGGNLPPHLRKTSLGPRARRLAGLFLGVSATMGAVALLAAGSFGLGWELLLSAAVVALFTSAAVKMYKSGREKH